MSHAEKQNGKKNMLLLSGSKAGKDAEGKKLGTLDWAEPWIKEFFAEPVTQGKPVLFVPYARPDGMTEEAYFEAIHDRLAKMGITAICAPADGKITPELLSQVGGIFVGGGHTPTLLHKLQQSGSIPVIREAVEAGLPYMGSSAGSLIACPTIKTNNDMPGPANDVIDLRSLGLINAQLNCHYIDDSMQDKDHNGETRDTRLKEFCTFNPNVSVLGLYEGQALRVQGNQTHLWTSPHTRAHKSPVFLNQTRTELDCEVGEPLNVSRMFQGAAKGWQPSF